MVKYFLFLSLFSLNLSAPSPVTFCNPPPALTQSLIIQASRNAEDVRAACLYDVVFLHGELALCATEKLKLLSPSLSNGSALEDRDTVGVRQQHNLVENSFT